MSDTPPCDLDPLEYNLETAFYDHRAGEERWKATRHGAGMPEFLKKCGCVVCVAELERRANYAGAGSELRSSTRPWSTPPAHVAADAVRARVRELLAAGWTRTTIAAAAGVDQASIDRILRPDVQRVRVKTNEAIFGLVIEPRHGFRAVGE